ncbi:hypothetical protein GQ53DRAFT_112286 [Thozetella sp. PMI_491]|nr:hypothetical protein GQ53DRAFT_112286 [Thozetella sp. PMI_491]
MQPSGANKGFFQRQPVLRNQYYDDVSLQRIVKLFLPAPIVEQVGPEIAQLGDAVLSPQIFDWISDSERNLPYLRGSGRDAFGKPKSELVVSEGWRKLQEFGFEKGMIAYNYDTNIGPLTRIAQFIRLHLWEASCSNTLCPAAMQDGAARLLQRHLANPGLDQDRREVFQNAFDHLISRDPSRTWTSGQWMTERTGGSDVSQTETVATHAQYPNRDTTPLSDLEENIPLGPYEINGFKWFSSATDSHMTILLAKTRPGKPVSAFFAPMRRYNPSLVYANGKEGGSELNGVNISRLKNKFGTQSLPTAELELVGMRGWLVGEEGMGIQEISTLLNITRAHSATSSVGYLGRGIGVAKAFALVREVGVGKGKRVPLCKHPLHMRTLANMTVDYHSLMLLVFYTLYLLGLEERGGDPSAPHVELTPGLQAVTPPTQYVGPLLRVLSSLHKAYVCETAIPLIYSCMSALGGVGYLLNSETEHMNISRLFRDACVLALWEGTTDVVSSDTIRALKHPKTGAENLGAIDWLVNAALTLNVDAQGVKAAKVEWQGLRDRIQSETQEQLLPEARKITFRVAEILIAALFVVDAKANPGPEINTLYQRYMTKKAFAAPSEAAESPVTRIATDLAIVYGSEFVSAHEASSKL